MTLPFSLILATAMWSFPHCHRAAAGSRYQRTNRPAQAGDILRKPAPASARMFTVWEKASALEKYTRAAGYTEEEANLFLKDKAQKARIKALATDYLTKAGAVAGDVESYCVVGRNEIAKNTLVGSILWSSK